MEGEGVGLEIRQLLHDFVVAQVGSDAEVRIDGLSRISTGRSRENWLFDASWNEEAGRKTDQLIVRRDPAGGLLETERSIEFAVLKALDQTDVPAPAVRWLDADGSALGSPSLVMVREPGSCDYFALEAASPANKRVDLAQRLCELLVTVHQVDWQRAEMGEVLNDPGPQAALDAVDHWESILRADQLEPYPELELCTRWLRTHAPTSTDTVLVHGDFKVGNVLLDDDDQIVSLLDWELAHLGDRHEDLGWVTQPLRTREHYVTGHWERDELLQHYAKVSGCDVDLAAVEWWNVMSCYKTAVMQSSGLKSFVEGRSDELYQPTAEVLTTILDLIGL